MAIQTKTQIHRISIAQVRRRIKHLVFVDARSATSLNRNRLQVSGASHVPVKTLEEELKQLPRNRTLVTYCT